MARRLPCTLQTNQNPELNNRNSVNQNPELNNQNSASQNPELTKHPELSTQISVLNQNPEGNQNSTIGRSLALH